MITITLPSWLAWLIIATVLFKGFEIILTILLHGMEWYEKKFMHTYKMMRGKDTDGL